MRTLIVYLVLVHVVLGVGVVRKIIQYTHPEPLPSERYISTRRQFLKVVDQSKPRGSIVFLGDSLTESLATSNIPNSVNYGIGYSTTKDINERIGDYDWTDVRMLVLMVGTNDALLGKEPEVLNLPDVPVLWYAAPPNARASVDKMNEGFRTQCAKHPKCRFVEITGSTYDGVHLNKTGNDAWLHSVKTSLH